MKFYDARFSYVIDLHLPVHLLEHGLLVPVASVGGELSFT